MALGQPVGPEQERPELRGGFRHPDLLRWVRERRGPLVAACLTLARAWVLKGRLAGSDVLGRMLGSFESWLDVVGGVLAVAGIEGLLENQEKLADHGDDELSPWKLFIHLWQEGQQQGYVPREAYAEQLLDAAEKAGLEIGDMGRQSQLRKLGRALTRIEGRVFGSLRIKSRVLNGRKQYRIERAP